MRRLLVLLVVALMVGGCWKKRVKHLSPAEFDHYYALKPFMGEDVEKGFLKLKTEEERSAYLQQAEFQGQKLWDMFYQYDEVERDAIVNGEVAMGWSADMVLMAWGAPHDKRKLVGRKFSRSEMFTYRFEVDEDGTIMVYDPEEGSSYHAIRHFTRRVILDDNAVTEIQEVQGWE